MAAGGHDNLDLGELYRHQTDLPNEVQAVFSPDGVYERFFSHRSPTHYELYTILLRAGLEGQIGLVANYAFVEEMPINFEEHVGKIFFARRESLRRRGSTSESHFKKPNGRKSLKCAPHLYTHYRKRNDGLYCVRKFWPRRQAENVECPILVHVTRPDDPPEVGTGAGEAPGRGATRKRRARAQQAEIDVSGMLNVD